MRDAVEEGPDIKVQHPVLFPAAPPSHGQRVVGRTPRTVTVAVGVKDRLQLLLQQHRRRGLGDSVGHIGHTQHPDPRPMILRYLHRPHRARQVTAGAHPVPQLVEVVPLRLPEPADADGVHAWRSAVGLDLHPRLMNEALIDLKRLHLRLRSNHQLLPVRGDLRSIWPARPLRSSPITEPSPLLRAGPPLCLASVLCPLRFRPLGVLPLATGTGTPRRYHPVVGIEATGSPVPCQRPRRAHATYTPDAARAARSPPPGSGLAPRAGLCPGDTHNLRFRRRRSTFRCVRSGSSMFVFSSHT